MNSKFLNEAMQLEARWLKTGLLDGIDRYSRSTCAVLLESMRFRGEMETEEEYEEYCENFKARTSRIMGRLPYKNHWLNGCTHENASCYGDTNPPTYKCNDCGAFFLKGQ